MHYKALKLKNNNKTGTGFCEEKKNRRKKEKKKIKAHQRDYNGKGKERENHTLQSLGADVVPSPFPHLVICSSLPTEQLLYQRSNKFIHATICLADGAGAEYRQSSASTCACHYQELIDSGARGEPCTQQEQQHVVPCLFKQDLQGERRWWRKEAKETRRF